MKKFLFLTDLHFGYERRNGHKVALHDERALKIVTTFAKDFKPDVLILGGDMLDCGAISHHNRHKPGRTEGLRLLSDAQECAERVIVPLASTAKQHIYITGNHEDWLNDLQDELPGLTGLVDIERLLGLDGWTVVPQGEAYNLGKLTFVHGDQLSGGEHIAKAAVINYERSIRFGHHHTHQVYTKNTPLDAKHAKTGVAVPCLCTRNPKYGEGKPNRWVQGFQYGYVFQDGSYHDSTALIINGRTVVDGRVYSG